MHAASANLRKQKPLEAIADQPKQAAASPFTAITARRPGRQSGHAARGAIVGRRLAGRCLIALAFMLMSMKNARALMAMLQTSAPSLAHDWAHYEVEAR